MILLTGATGFLGRITLRQLISTNQKVRILVRNPEKIKDDIDFQSVEVFEGNLLDILSLEKALEGVDKVIHMAAVVSFRKSEHAYMHRNNVQGTANLVNACLDKPIKKFVFVSSIAALGRNLQQELITETTQWKDDGHNSAYAHSKYKSELEVHRGVAEGLPAVITLPGVILGPGENWTLGSPRLFKMIWKGFPFYNTGSNGFVGADDVANALIRMLDSPHIHGEKFILVSQNITYQLLFSLIARALGKKGPYIRVQGIWAKTMGRISELMGGISGTKPLLTYETARTSSHNYTYDGSNYSRTFGVEYIPIETVVQETANIFLQQYGSTH